MKGFAVRGFAAAMLGMILSVQAAMAAEPVFPPASRVGLVPPDDMVTSKRFTGFENFEKAAAISIVEMPAEAYGQLVTGMTKDAMKRQGMDVTSREDVTFGDKAGVLIAGAMTGPVKGRKWVLAVKGQDMTALLIAQVQGGSDGYSEDQMREALKSVALRAPVSLDEQISALPFRIGDRAGFRPVRVVSGNSVVFTEGPLDIIKAVEQPIVILAVSLQPPPPSGERREQFARAALNANSTFKEVRFERSDTFRLKGQEWHEIVATAKDAESGEPIVVVQTIRFEPDRYVRMVGMTRASERDRNLSRFRNVIDTVEMDP